MILSFLSFGITWVALAIIYFGLEHILPGFHSNYPQLYWAQGFKLGFIDALILKGTQLAGVNPLNPIVYLVILGLDGLLVAISNHPERGFYVSGLTAPILSAIVLTVAALAIEICKEWYRRKQVA